MSKERLKEKNKQELIRYLDNLMKSDAFISQGKLIRERQKTIKSGADVHLEYLGHLLNESDIQEIEWELKKQNLQFSYFNKSGIIYNSNPDYSLTTYFILTKPILKLLLKGIAINATWDCLKYLIAKTWKKIKKNKKPSDKKLSFGISVSLDENTSFNIELDGSEKQVLAVLDKILPFLKKQSRNKNKEKNYIYFDKKNKILVKVDVMKEHRKKALKQKIERQKEAVKKGK